MPRGSGRGGRPATAVGLLLTVVLAVVSLLAAGPISAAEPAGAVFDDFDGPAGAGPDPRLWSFDLGPWPKQLQVYTNSRDNVRLDGEGNLVIEARRAGDGLITSGRVTTRGHLDMRYGTLSARIKMPAGQGISPAFWLLGAQTDAEGWPHTGEIDIVEAPGTSTYYYTTIHGPWIGPPPSPKPDYKVWAEGPIDDLAAGFHTFWASRSPYVMVIGMDDRTLATFTPDSLAPKMKWAFEQPMNAILNVAVGDPWAGPPDDTTPWPSALLVDWVRWVPA